MQRTVRRYTAVGFLFGLCFPLGGWTFELLMSDLPFSWKSIVLIHRDVPVHWIIDSAPFVLGFTGYMIGKLQYKVEKDKRLLQRQLSRSKKLNKARKKNQERIRKFANQLSRGNIDFKVKVKSEDDFVGQSLVSIQDKLLSASEADRREKWKANGMADFLQILRDNQDNLEDLTRQVIGKLVQFVDGNQGSIHVVEEDETKQSVQLTTIATYAWERQKFAEGTIRPGEGIVGQVFLERKTTYMTNLPKDYIRITSGLGQANPSALLVVPLMYNQEIMGVLEIATFNNFEDYQIAFIEKLAENIASTLTAVKGSEKTTKLLQTTQEMAESLQAQEEELRQNAEEMQATQEEQERKIRVLENKLREMEEEYGQLDYDEQGRRLIKE